MSFLVSKPERIRRWVSEKFIVEGLRDLELFGEQPPGDARRKTNEASSESIAPSPKRAAMSSFLPEGGYYKLLTIIGKGFEELMTVNLARYKPSGEYVTVRRVNLEACTNEMVTFLQGELHVSKLFNHPNLVPYRATFVADNELWVVTSFMAYGAAEGTGLHPPHGLRAQNLQGYNAKSDIYSVGITACELANGHVPFKDMPATQMLLEKLNGTVPCLLDTTTIPAEELAVDAARSGANWGPGEGLAAGGTRPSNGDSLPHPYHRTFSPHFHHFVELCLQRSPDLRPTASTLLGHSFFKQIKRRACEALPELLRPVTPITSFEGSSQPQDPSGIFGLVSSLEQLDVDDWEF
ncbi:STE20-related kinase adapter protein alpha isoform X4 [Tachyglossus aculeatus]|uniref:STE20-related kinase adapter protein alpha isoform X4 n=1 Tax=Tachyglossus aculeatus TaxID=9261 RepID=UPI0018F53F90|nr:STE20-related kinase adapter protein alpha isoform X4 [Tachyglossus aculeatus]